ncbi:MAG: [LysW]-lysine hydrolase [Anaerolineae bacterium]
MQTNAIDLLTELVSIPSPSGREGAASACLVDWLAGRGLEARVDAAGNAVGVKGDGEREILLLGHIDTFPGELPVRREGDLLYGRGAVDAKGPLCAFAAATAQVDVPAGWRVTVVGAVEEECATSKGARHVLARRAQRAQPPVYGIIGEPSRWDRVTLGYKGRLLLDLILRAPFAHSAGQARLPAERGVDLWRAVEDYCAALNAERGATRAFERLEPSLRRIASRDDGAFGEVEMSLGFRLPLDVAPAALEAGLAGVIAQAVDPAQTTPAITLSTQFSGAESAYKGGKANPLVRAFLAAIREAGGRPRFVVKTGTSDMNVVGPRWPATPLVAYGPGDSALDHTPQEHTSLAEFSRSIEILEYVLHRLMET